MTTRNNLTVVETGKYYQSSSRRQHSRKYQLTKWSTLFIALVVALMTASLISTINRRAERSNQTQILLIYIKEQLTQLNALEWQVVAEKKLSYELFAKVQDVHTQAHFINQKLEAIEPNKLKLQKFSQLYKKYDIAVEEEFKLFAAGQITKAVIIDEEVDPTYDKLSNEIIKLDAHYSNQKHQASQIAERGSVLGATQKSGIGKGSVKNTKKSRMP